MKLIEGLILFIYIKKKVRKKEKCYTIKNNIPYYSSLLTDGDGSTEAPNLMIKLAINNIFLKDPNVGAVM